VMANRPWTPEGEEELLELRAFGVPLRLLAKRLGRPKPQSLAAPGCCKRLSWRPLLFRMSPVGTKLPGRSVKRSLSRGKRTPNEAAILVTFDPERRVAGLSGTGQKTPQSLHLRVLRY
jgi:hypothetical protein